MPKVKVKICMDDDRAGKARPVTYHSSRRQSAVRERIVEYIDKRIERMSDDELIRLWMRLVAVLPEEEKNAREI